MDCSRCDAQAVYKRPYSGESLCRKHFLLSVERQVRRTISKYGMFRRADKIAIAVSGGKDSLSLMHILRLIERDFPTGLSVITVDEGVSGYRDEAIGIVEKNCKSLGIELKTVAFRDVFRWDVDEIVETTQEAHGELGPCSFCGVLRRKALNAAAREIGATKLVTGHNLDDEVQTMLLNLVHGDIFRSARVEPLTKVIHPKFVPRVKPLCETPESEITLYAYLSGFEFQSVRCPHAGFALRNNIRDFVNKLELDHPSVKFTIFRTFEKLRPLLKSSVQAQLKSCRVCGEPTISDICEPCSMLHRIEALGKV